MAEMEEIRAANRAKLGLAGVPPRPGMGAFGLPDVNSLFSEARLRTAFPAVEVAWSPGQVEPTSREGSLWSEWMLRHVVRPEAAFQTSLGEMRFAPYEADSDLSGLARALAIGAAIVGGITVGFVLVRAL